MTQPSKSVDPRGQMSAAQRAFERIGIAGRKNPIAKKLVEASRYIMRGYNGAPAALVHIDTNGEAWALSKLGARLTTVFDVGANVGEWTKYALASGAKEVHAFEISPTTADAFAAQHGTDNRVRLNRFGLSDSAGTITINHFPDLPVLTTVTDFPWEIPSEKIDVQVRTGDEYVAENHVETIDFLKVDVEGAEEAVLRGLTQTFERGAIGAVQFEYGKYVVLTKYMLRDFYLDLTKWGFKIGQLRPTKWEPTDFKLEMETLTDANYLAIHESRTDLLDLLKR